MRALDMNGRHGEWRSLLFMVGFCIAKFWPEHKEAFLVGEFTMSRCFPFPPPGFELKARPDDVNLIIKEKKEKKHKKHKDRDKKERSKRKEKERSEGDQKENKKHKKHTDKDKKERSKRKEKERSEGDQKENKKRKREKDKDKKERKRKKKDNQISKERSKRKEKERSEGDQKENKKRKREKDKDKKERKRKKKDNQISSEGEKNVGFLGNQNGGELGTDGKPTDVIRDQETFPKLGKQIGDDGGAQGNQMVQKITLVVKTKVNLEKAEHSKMANGQSFNVDARRLENGYIGNGNGENRIKIEGGSCKVDKVEKRDRNRRNGYGTTFSEGGCKNEDQNRNIKAKETNGYSTGFGEGNVRRNEDQNKITRPLDKEDGKEKIKQGPSDFSFLFSANKPSNLVRNGQGNLTKPKGLNGFSNGVRPNNMSMPALSCSVEKEKGPCSVEKEKGVVVTNRKGNYKISSPQSVINNHGLSNGHLLHIKRKMEPCPPTNTIPKVIPIVNNQSADGKIPLKHPLLENGRPIHKMDIKELRMNGSVENGRHTTSPKPSCSATNTIPKVNLIVNNHSADQKIQSKHPILENGRPIQKTDIKELKMNGSVENGKHPTSSASTKPKKLQPPHRDLKYLNGIYSVPREVELPQCDDEGWLFGCTDKGPKLGSSPNQCTKQVWAEAMQLEPVDITALPYVVPF